METNLTYIKLDTHSPLGGDKYYDYRPIDSSDELVAAITADPTIDKIIIDWDNNLHKAHDFLENRDIIESLKALPNLQHFEFNNANEHTLIEFSRFLMQNSSLIHLNLTGTKVNIYSTGFYMLLHHIKKNVSLKHLHLNFSSDSCLCKINDFNVIEFIKYIIREREYEVINCSINSDSNQQQVDSIKDCLMWNRSIQSFKFSFSMHNVAIEGTRNVWLPYHHYKYDRKFRNNIELLMLLHHQCFAIIPVEVLFIMIDLI